jgi:HlyD family secretion protein
MSMKRLALLVGLLAAVGLAAAAYSRFVRTPAVPDIVTSPVTRGDIVESVGATGTLEAVTTVQVGTQVSGTIKQLFADFNAVVRRGQVIARLDPSLFETQIEQARANLLRSDADVERFRVAVDDAQSKLKRAEELSARGLIPQQELESAQLALRTSEAQLRSAQAAVSQARATLNQNQVNLQHTVIEAPIDGIVISRNVDVGQTVAASMQAPTLYVIAADLTKMRVNANVDEADVGRIRPGQRVRFRVDAYPVEEFVGTLSQVRLQPQVVQNVVTYNTVIDVPNPDFKLKPGMTANVNIEIAHRNAVVRVPNAALRFRPTPEMFAALGQPAPADESRGGAGRRGAEGSAGAPQVPTPRSDSRSQMSEPAQRPLAERSGPGPGDERRIPASGPRSRAGELSDGRRLAGAPADGMPDEATRRGDDDRDLRPLRETDRPQGIISEARQAASDPAADHRPGASPGTAGSSAERRSIPASTSAEAGRDMPTARWRQAQTVDALFGPLPSEESAGRAWTLANGRLEPVRLRLGISDGTFTEVIGNGLAPGTLVVTSIALPVQAGRTAGAGQSPLMGPQRGPGPAGVRNAAPGGRR